jgi:hypothetical protein
MKTSWLKNYMGRDHLGNIDINRKEILKHIADI